jgi:hypothetical protein
MFKRLPVLENRQDNRQPTAASAAATTITKNANRWPFHLFVLVGKRDEAQIHGVEHQLDRHEHGDDVAAEQKPATPSANRIALSVRYQESGTSGSSIHLLSRQNDAPDNGDQDQHAGDFKRQQVGGEQRRPTSRACRP